MSKHLSAVRRIGAKAVRHRLALPAALLVSALGIASVPAGSIASASASSTGKSFTVNATPAGALYAGTPGTVAYAIANASNQQSFGSAEISFPTSPTLSTSVISPTGLCPQASNVSPPYGVCIVAPLSGWSVSEVSTSPATFLLEADTSATAVLPGSELDFSLSVDVPPAGTALTYVPTVVVKQANDFNGSGNQFQNAGGSSTFTVDPGGYTLNFVASAITVDQSFPSDDAYNFICPNVQVQATAPDGSPVSGVEVTVGADLTHGDPGLAYLISGNPATPIAATNSDGIAFFGSTAAPCTDGFAAANASPSSGSFELTATANGALAPAPEIPLTVNPVSGACSPVGTSPCTGSLQNPNSNPNILVADISLARDSSRGYTYTGQYGSIPLACDAAITGAAFPASELQFQIQDTDPSLGGTVSVVYSKAVVDAITNNGTPGLPVCAAADVNFPSYDSSTTTINDTLYYEGLLYDCTDPTYLADIKHTHEYPLQMCVESRSKAGFQGGEQVTIYSSSLIDPFYGF